MYIPYLLDAKYLRKLPIYVITRNPFLQDKNYNYINCDERHDMIINVIVCKSAWRIGKVV
jgi:hypothetical protein